MLGRRDILARQGSARFLVSTVRAEPGARGPSFPQQDRPLPPHSASRLGCSAVAAAVVRATGAAGRPTARGPGQHPSWRRRDAVLRLGGPLAGGEVPPLAPQAAGSEVVGQKPARAHCNPQSLGPGVLF